MARAVAIPFSMLSPATWIGGTLAFGAALWLAALASGAEPPPGWAPARQPFASQSFPSAAAAASAVPALPAQATNSARANDAAARSGPPAQSGQPGQPGQPLATRNTAFTIPFNVQPPREPGEQPIEIHLYVSADRGANWTLYGRQHPTAKVFPFRAAADGEYWFASRTVDRSGRSRPAGSPQPELRVVVDTTPPQLQLLASIGPAGEIDTSWRAYDEGLVAESFQISYQLPGEPSWQPVTVESPRGGPSATSIDGQAKWWARALEGDVAIRAEVRDRAGNATVVNRRLTLPRVATAPGGGARPNYERTPLAPSSPSLAGMPSSGAIPWPSGEEGRGALPHPSDLASGGMYQPVQGTPSPAVGRMASSPHDRSAGAAAAGSPPAGVVPRMTNARRFHLQYGVENTAAAIEKVELWGTRDGGRSWTSWGIDADRQSPLLVEIDGEGMYGFRIVVDLAGGLAGAAPRSGDPPDVWIAVDATPPAARIESAAFGAGAAAGQLDIRWTASDPYLDPRGVTLLASEAPSGPWRPIAENVPNTGRHLWRIDGRPPRQVYLRLEVRDQAGNVGTHQLAEPVDLEGLLPKARILGLEPLPAP